MSTRHVTVERLTLSEAQQPSLSVNTATPTPPEAQGAGRTASGEVASPTGISRTHPFSQNEPYISVNGASRSRLMANGSTIAPLHDGLQDSISPARRLREAFCARPAPSFHLPASICAP